MVAKDILNFATVTDSGIEANFMGFSHDYGILNTTSWKVSQKMKILLNISNKFNFSQLSVMVAKGKIYFANLI